MLSLSLSLNSMMKRAKAGTFRLEKRRRTSLNSVSAVCSREWQTKEQRIPEGMETGEFGGLRRLDLASYSLSSEDHIFLTTSIKMLKKNSWLIDAFG